MKNKKKLGMTIAIATALLSLGTWLLLGKWMTDGMKPLADGSYDYAIILGAKVNGETPSLTLRYRLEKALSYAEAHPEVKFILSGGQGPDEDVAEGEAMRRYLTERGVHEERLLLEIESTSTYENLLYSKELLPVDVNAVTIITSDFHLARARMIADSLDLVTDALPAKTPPSVEAKHNVRERLALIKTVIVGK